MQEIFKNKESFIEQYRQACKTHMGKTFEDCSDQDRYQALAFLIADKGREIGALWDKECVQNQKKRVYYFSLEFLMGPLLDNYLINFGARDVVADGLAELGASLDELEKLERDPGLGNGGLGRLAACFLASMAHEGISGYGNGMRYRYGLFHQSIKDGRQVEETDNWLENGFPWETRLPGSAVEVTFGGDVVRHEDEQGNFWYSVENGDRVKAVPYDVPIIGYGGKVVNKLRLWSTEPAEEKFDLDAFNEGDYAKANAHRAEVEAISEILYPNDAGEHGRILRLKQEYLFVSAGLQTILRTFRKNYGPDWGRLPELVAIHTNDTHPAMCGPELMRILVDEEKLDWDTAWDITTRTISFTNHTVMPEALERWPIDTFRRILPRLYMYVDEINRRYLESLATQVEDWHRVGSETAVLWDGQVRMANLSIICAHSVNGVSEIHTGILKRETFAAFNSLMGDKFNNKTNGVSQRRFLAEANPALSSLINETIGNGWMDDCEKLSGLEAHLNDSALLGSWMDAKRKDKERLAAYIKETTGVVLDPSSFFDVQVKRFHAYKRQLLNVLKIMDLYNRMIADPNYKPQPTSFIFSGKAAQSYVFAKEVIRLIHSVADVVNNDPRVNEYIKVAFVPNFAVSNAQLIYPATDISEQISTAGMEASGTSNMKLMMNGAITLGTYDGANIEIAELAGEKNIKIFGLRVEDIERLKQEGYWSRAEYDADRERLGVCVDQLIDGSFGTMIDTFEMIHDDLMTNNDQWFVMRDFRPYVQAWEELRAQGEDSHAWAQMSLLNTARSGHFSSDRTIREYAADIWHA